MSFSFKKIDIDNISKVLNAQPQELERSWSWKFHNSASGNSIAFTIYNEVRLSAGLDGSLISVQTQHGYFEMHNCVGYIIFEPDEVIFVQANNESVSSLIIGREGTCSMYTNISRDILKADFNTLDAAVLLSAMQLSLTETVLPEA